MCEELFFNDESDRDKLFVQMFNADIAAASMHYSRKTVKYKYAR